MDIKKLGEWFVGSFTYNANGIAKREQQITSQPGNLTAISIEPARSAGIFKNSDKKPHTVDEQAVTLSSDSHQLFLGGEKQSRQQKISTIKQQIESGTYKPNSREVAAALFAELF